MIKWCHAKLFHEVHDCLPYQIWLLYKSNGVSMHGQDRQTYLYTRKFHRSHIRCYFLLRNKVHVLYTWSNLGCTSELGCMYCLFDRLSRDLCFVQNQLPVMSVKEVYSTVTNKLCGRPPQYAPAPCKLTFDLLTLKVVSESRTTWPTSVPILVFLGLSVLDLGPMYATDVKQTSDAHHRLMPPTLGAGA